MQGTHKEIHLCTLNYARLFLFHHSHLLNAVDDVLKISRNNSVSLSFLAHNSMWKITARKTLLEWTALKCVID